MKKVEINAGEYSNLKQDRELLNFILKTVYGTGKVDWMVNGDVFIDDKLIGNSNSEKK